MGRGQAVQSDSSVLLYGPLAARSRAAVADVILPKLAWSQRISDSLLSDLKSVSQNPRYNWLDILGDLEHYQRVGWKTFMRRTSTYVRPTGGLVRNRQPRKVDPATLVRVDVFVAASHLDPETRGRIHDEPTEDCVTSGQGLYVESMVHASSLEIEPA